MPIQIAGGNCILCFNSFESTADQSMQGWESHAWQAAIVPLLGVDAFQARLYVVIQRCGGQRNCMAACLV